MSRAITGRIGVLLCPEMSATPVAGSASMLPNPLRSV